MWGNIFLETIFKGNYTFGFLTNRSSTLLHLTHWQYWFWFWFTWFLGLYYVLFLNFFFKRSLQFHPKISTTFLSHGKWGDVLVCVLPISWCLNILTNSNFILRLVEWQSESSLFSLRVRGKQWYWIYKIDINNIGSLQNSNKQVGFNNWKVFSNKAGIINDVTQLQNKLIFQKNFWKKSIKMPSTTKHDIKFTQTQVFKGSLRQTNSLGFFNSLKLVNLDQKINNLNKQPSKISLSLISSQKPCVYTISNNFFKKTYFFSKTLSNSKNFTNNDVAWKEPAFKKNNTFFYKNMSLNFLKKNNIFLKKTSKNSFFIIKQKRFIYKNYKNNLNFLKKNKVFFEKLENVFFYKNFKNFYKNNFIFNKRLLRTNKLVILPVNVNISIITNSFDVIHSWFLPGLGLKMDCVPGRSTHHTLHIANPGFYYGQCAEICGRYHHHMPIRICAVNYVHFIFWWQNKGIRQFFELK